MEEASQAIRPGPSENSGGETPLWEMQPFRQNLFVLMKESWKLYLKHGIAFTKVICPPLLYQVGGIFIAIFGPIRAMHFLIEDLKLLNPFTILGWILIIFLIPAIYVITRGVWDYLVYMVSFNLNTVELLQGQHSVHFKKAYARIANQEKATPYTLFLLLTMILWLIPLAIEVFPLYFVQTASQELVTINNPDSPPFVMTSVFFTCSLVGGLFSIALLVLSVYFSLGFQVIAFEPITKNPFLILKRSFQLVKGHFWRVLGLSLAVGFMIMGIIPGILTLILDISGISRFLSQFFMEGLLAEILTNTIPNYEAYFQQVDRFVSMIDANLSMLSLLSIIFVDLIFQSLVVALLLPIGTFHYALLYFDLLARKKEAGPPSVSPETEDSSKNHCPESSKLDAPQSPKGAYPESLG